MRLPHLITVTLVLLIIASPASGQMTVDRVLDNMRDAYERGIQNIDDYTIITDMYTAYYKKTYVDGRPTFKSRTEIKGMEHLGSAGVSTSTVGHTELFDVETYNYLKENARYEGKETVEGTETHVLFVREMKQLGEQRDDDETVKNARFYVDANEWIIRQMQFDVETKDDSGQIVVVKPVMRLLDYRNISGMKVPFRTVIDMGDMDQQITPEERAEARRSMAELKQQMESMPEQQRKMMEGMLRPQIERLEKMLEGDTIQFVIEVEDVKVNTGLPDDLFEE
jgi:hypothetical protein